jgi:hypothetical protein
LPAVKLLLYPPRFERVPDFAKGTTVVPTNTAPMGTLQHAEYRRPTKLLPAMVFAIAAVLPVVDRSFAAREERPMTLVITSTAYASGGAIPALYTCEGKDISPSIGLERRAAGNK